MSEHLGTLYLLLIISGKFNETFFAGRDGKTTEKSFNLDRTVLSFRKRLLYNLFIGLVFTLVLIILAETFLRWYVRTYRQPSFESYKQYDPEIGWSLKPGFRSEKITINSHGFRGPEILAPKPGNVTRIVIVGNSCVFGSGLADSETLPYFLQKYLNQAQQRFEVINAGVPGYASEHTLKRLHRDVLPLDPDLVIVYCGWNDYFFFYPGDPQFNRQHSRLFNLALEHSYILKLFTKIVFQKLRPRMEGTSPNDLELYRDFTPHPFITNYKKIVSLLRSRNIPFLCLTLPSALADSDRGKYRNRFVYPFYTTNLEKLEILWKKYNTLIRDIGEDRVFDLASHINTLDDPASLFLDMHHLNSKGTDVAARALSAKIIQSDKDDQ